MDKHKPADAKTIPVPSTPAGNTAGSKDRPDEGMASAALGCLEHVIDELAEAHAMRWLLTFELVRVREPAVEYPTTSA